MVRQGAASDSATRERSGVAPVAGTPATTVLAAAIGVGSVGVGAFQFGAPRRAARLFGVPTDPDPASTIMVRGVGARDLLTGCALLYSAVRRLDYRPWLGLRAASDMADGVGGALSLRAGTRCPQQIRTTRLALVLGIVEAIAWRASLVPTDRPRRRVGSARTCR
ncbi:MAG TPA: DUF4267 domain-containing protein [Micromonosporaceae bacterium]|nr:DUF4267 domain-containing protein [Micromonosporaceae bacterium]